MTVYLYSNGDDVYHGSISGYDQVDYDAPLSEFAIFRNTDGSVTVSHVSRGTDTLYNIDGIWSDADQSWYSIDDAIAQTDDHLNNLTINGTSKDNDLFGGNGDDTIYGRNGDDLLDGGNGVDRLIGGNGEDVLDGGNGNDRLIGGNGNDRLLGGNGVDKLFGGNGNDALFGNGGRDVLDGGNGADRLVGAGGADRLSGGSDEDTLIGGNGNDALFGNSGQDVLEGGNGGDRLYGGGSADILNGGAGNDLLIGGFGKDSFVFESGDGHDLIEDFEVGRDAIDLSALGLSFDELNITVNSEGHVAIFINENQSIALSNLSDPHDLDANDFIFGDGQTPTPEPEPEPEPTPEPAPTGPNTGTLINGVITGSNDVNDTLIGDDGNDTFFAGRGTDVIQGGAGNDTLNVDGDIFEWTFTENNDGSVTMTHPTWGENTLVGIEQITSQRSGQTFSIDEAIASTNGLPDLRIDNDNVINGTNGNDTIVSSAGIQGLYGGLGDDAYFGTDGFDQINYDGARSEYNIFQNGDGSITVDHPIWGTDTLNNIEALIFTGVEPGVGGAQSAPFEFIATDDLFG